jgi:hypothetical protein
VFHRRLVLKATGHKENEMNDELLQIRRVIDGKVYDTATAVLVHVLSADGGSIGLNFRVDRTALYRTRNGRFFIAGESGAYGRWGRSVAGGYIPGTGLELITDMEAQRLLEEANGPVEEFFDVVEG